MQETGKIIKIKKNMATVRVNRKSACASCGMCAIKPNDLYVDIQLENTLNAKLSDRVVLDISSGSIAKMSMIAYLLPLALAVLLLVTVYLLNLPEWVALLNFFCGLTIGIVIVIVLDKKIYQNTKNRPKMIKILYEQNINSEEKTNE